MSLQHAYATVNKAAGLAASAFTWSTGATTDKAFLNDGRMDKQMSVGAVLTNAFLYIDFGAAVTLSAIAALNTNIAEATTPIMRVRTADDLAFTTNVVTRKADSSLNATAPRHKDHILQFPAVSSRYWEVGFGWLGTFTLRIGEVFAAQPTALTRYTAYGHGEREEYVTTGFRGYSGETRGHFIAGPYREKALVFADVSTTERDELLAMRRATNGGATPLLWIHQYEAVGTAAAAAYQDVIFGRADLPDWGWTEPDFNRFDLDGWTVRSLAREVGS